MDEVQGAQIEKRFDHIETSLKLGFAEQRAEAKTIQLDIQRLDNKVAVQNGRVGKLEEWKNEQMIKEAHLAGVAEGRTGLSRFQFAIFMGILTAAGIISGVVINIINSFI